MRAILHSCFGARFPRQAERGAAEESPRESSIRTHSPNVLVIALRAASAHPARFGVADATVSRRRDRRRGLSRQAARRDGGTLLAAVAGAVRHRRLGSAKPPTEWSETKNIRWKVEIPGRGSSSPVIWGDRVFVLSAVPIGVAGPRRTRRAAGSRSAIAIASW